jgi:hypothetical protein
MGVSESKSFMANAVVYIYDKVTNAWNKKGVSRVFVFEDVLGMTFRVVARSIAQPSDVCRN